MVQKKIRRDSGVAPAFHIKEERSDNPIYNLRVRLKQSQIEFADTLNITQGTVSKFERGISAPTIAELNIVKDIATKKEFYEIVEYFANALDWETRKKNMGNGARQRKKTIDSKQ